MVRGTGTGLTGCAASKEGEKSPSAHNHKNVFLHLQSWLIECKKKKKKNCNEGIN